MASRTTNTDRLIFTLLFSVIIHLVIVLGISFNVTSPPTNTPLVNLDITLVKQQTEEAPEQADFYA
ncbi:MAG: energy transducer TonB, partial [Methylophagaceae bacterium]